MVNIRKIKNLLWLFFGKFGIVFLSFFTFVSFALYLTPEELGKGALIIALIELLSVFFSSMLETPLVRKSRLTSLDKASVFWYGGLTSIFSSLLLVGTVHLIYDDESMWTLTAFGCLKFLFSNLSRGFIAQLRIERRFKALTIRTLFGKVIGAGTAIIFAYNGAGELSVVVQPVVMEFFSFTILVWGAGVPALKKCRFTRFLEVVSEGYSYAIKFSINSLFEKMTVFILSITISLEVVGYYTFARRLIELPRAALQSAINTYSIPVFSAKVEKKQNVSEFFNDISLISYIAFAPIFVWYGIIFSELLVPIFGDKWINSTIIFLALSLVASIRMIDLYLPALLASYAKSKIGLIKETVNTISSIVLVFFTSTLFGLWGAVSTSAIYAISTVVIRHKSSSKVIANANYLLPIFKVKLVILVFATLCIYVNSILLSSIILKVVFSLISFALSLACVALTNRGVFYKAKRIMV